MFVKYQFSFFEGPAWIHIPEFFLIFSIFLLIFYMFFILKEQKDMQSYVLLVFGITYFLSFVLCNNPNANGLVQVDYLVTKFFMMQNLCYLYIFHIVFVKYIDIQFNEIYIGFLLFVLILLMGTKLNEEELMLLNNYTGIPVRDVAFEFVPKNSNVTPVSSNANGMQWFFGIVAFWLYLQFPFIGGAVGGATSMTGPDVGDIVNNCGYIYTTCHIYLYMTLKFLGLGCLMSYPVDAIISTMDIISAGEIGDIPVQVSDVWNSAVEARYSGIWYYPEPVDLDRHLNIRDAYLRNTPREQLVVNIAGLIKILLIEGDEESVRQILLNICHDNPDLYGDLGMQLSSWTCDARHHMYGDVDRWVHKIDMEHTDLVKYQEWLRSHKFTRVR